MAQTPLKRFLFDAGATLVALESTKACQAADIDRGMLSRFCRGAQEPSLTEAEAVRLGCEELTGRDVRMDQIFDVKVTI